MNRLSNGLSRSALLLLLVICFTLDPICLAEDQGRAVAKSVTDNGAQQTEFSFPAGATRTPRYAVVNLGQTGYASRLSDSGFVLLQKDHDGEIAGYRWHAGNLESLRGLGDDPDDRVRGIANDGTVVGKVRLYVDHSPFRSAEQAAIWLPGSTEQQSLAYTGPVFEPNFDGLGFRSTTSFINGSGQIWGDMTVHTVAGYALADGVRWNSAGADPIRLGAYDAQPTNDGYYFISGLRVFPLCANNSGLLAKEEQMDDSIFGGYFIGNNLVFFSPVALNAAGHAVGSPSDPLFGWIGPGITWWDGTTEHAVGDGTGWPSALDADDNILAQNPEGPVLWQRMASTDPEAPTHQMQSLNQLIPLGYSMDYISDMNAGGSILGSGYTSETGYGNFLLIPGTIAVDANRDGKIKLAKEDGSDQPSAVTPFRIWLNDDDDSGDEAGSSAFTGNSDEPGKLVGWFEFDGRTPDHAHGGVDGRCDLIDFFPVYLDLKQLLTVLPPTLEGIEYRLKQADGALNFVYTDLVRDRAFDYLTEEAAIYGTGFNQLPHLADTVAITSQGVALTATFLEKVKNDADKGVILIEGKKTTDKPLVVEVFVGGHSMARVQIDLKVSGVEKMYRWINLRGVAGQTEKRPTDISQPENYPDGTTNGKMFVWVHGYNVNEQQSRAWNAEAFKRLYQSGSRAMFTAFSWHGDYSQIPFVGVSPDYWENITSAFKTATALPAVFHTLPGSVKIIAGHSMGNIVVSSAISDNGMSVSKYFMLNAAVALEAYDTNAMSIEAMRHPDWTSYDPSLWSTSWYQLFPGDGRAGLTWLNRFGDIPKGINFYSSGEEVLNNNDTASNGTPGQVPGLGAERLWVLQEMVKGTKHFGAVLTFDSQGGWGFNGDWAIAETTTTGTATYRRRTPAEALMLTSEQLKNEPFFRRFQDSRLTTSGGSAAASEFLNRAQILGGAIPALSFPAGRNPVPRFEQQQRNADVMDFQDGWPQSRLTDPSKRTSDGRGRWFHSDVKNIAYRFNHLLWESMVQQGALK